MGALIKVRKDNLNTDKLFCWCLSCPSWPTSFLYYYSFIFSLWAQGNWAALPTRLSSAHTWSTAPLMIHISVSLWTLAGGTLGACRQEMPSHHLEQMHHMHHGDGKAPAVQQGPSLGSPSLHRTHLMSSHAPTAAEAAPHRGHVFHCPLWLSISLSLLPERKAGFSLALSHLAGTPNMPLGSSQNCLSCLGF